MQSKTRRKTHIDGVFLGISILSQIGQKNSQKKIENFEVSEHFGKNFSLEKTKEEFRINKKRKKNEISNNFIQKL